MSGDNATGRHVAAINPQALSPENFVRILIAAAARSITVEPAYYDCPISIGPLEDTARCLACPKIIGTDINLGKVWREGSLQSKKVLKTYPDSPSLRLPSFGQHAHCHRFVKVHYTC